MAKDRAFNRFLQDLLRKAGYDIASTGKIKAGDKTHKALADFQKALGLDVTGTATDETIKALQAFKPTGIAASGQISKRPGPSTTGSLEPPRLEGAGTLGSPQRMAVTQKNPLELLDNPEVPLGPPADVPLTGPGGSPAEHYGNTPISNLLMAIVPDWYGSVRQPLPEYSTANSPLAGSYSYAPPPDPVMRHAAPVQPRQEISPEMMRQAFQRRYAPPAAPPVREQPPARVSAPSASLIGQTVGVPWGPEYPDFASFMRALMSDPRDALGPR